MFETLRFNIGGAQLTGISLAKPHLEYDKPSHFRRSQQEITGNDTDKKIRKGQKSTDNVIARDMSSTSVNKITKKEDNVPTSSHQYSDREPLAVSDIHMDVPHVWHFPEANRAKGEFNTELRAPISLTEENTVGNKKADPRYETESKRDQPTPIQHRNSERISSQSFPVEMNASAADEDQGSRTTVGQYAEVLWNAVSAMKDSVTIIVADEMRSLLPDSIVTLLIDTDSHEHRSKVVKRSANAGKNSPTRQT